MIVATPDRLDRLRAVGQRADPASVAGRRWCWCRWRRRRCRNRPIALPDDVVRRDRDHRRARRRARTSTCRPYSHLAPGDIVRARRGADVVTLLHPRRLQLLRHAAAEAALERDAERTRAAPRAGPAAPSLHRRHAAVACAIRNFVHRRRRVELDFAPGFTVLTGETGAGKSILIDALLLALGERAEADVVREGAARAEISRRVPRRRRGGARGWRRRTLADADDDTRAAAPRPIDAGGRSTRLRQRLRRSRWRSCASSASCCSTCTASTRTSRCCSRAAQRRAARRARRARRRSARDAGRRRGADWQRAQRRASEAEAMDGSARAEQDRLRWIVEELGALAPQPGEWDAVQAEHKRLSHAAEPARRRAGGGRRAGRSRRLGAGADRQRQPRGSTHAGGLRRAACSPRVDALIGAARSSSTTPRARCTRYLGRHRPRRRAAGRASRRGCRRCTRAGAQVQVRAGAAAPTLLDGARGAAGGARRRRATSTRCARAEAAPRGALRSRRRAPDRRARAGRGATHGPAR
ncbi:MAG: AAA family ATPase [Comamonadaceae bacterium]|nr:AAA family ATPase [Comamonadaceae bacterium]